MFFGELCSKYNPEYYSGDYMVLHYHLTVLSLCDRNSIYLAISDTEFWPLEHKCLQVFSLSTLPLCSFLLTKILRFLYLKKKILIPTHSFINCPISPPLHSPLYFPSSLSLLTHFNLVDPPPHKLPSGIAFLVLLLL